VRPTSENVKRIKKENNEGPSTARPRAYLLITIDSYQHQSGDTRLQT